MLASGRGTNLQAILDRVHGREIDPAASRGQRAAGELSSGRGPGATAGGIEVVGVASNKPDAPALERARAAGVDTAVFERSEAEGREARDQRIAAWLEGLGVDLVVLAGYMELLSASFVARFRNRIINVHPALLPSFPGLEAIDRALEHGVKVTGVTVHFVDEGVDSGPIILQRPIDLTYTRDRAEVEEEVHRVEHELLPYAIRLIAAGRVRIDERNPRLVRIEAEAGDPGALSEGGPAEIGGEAAWAPR